MGSSMTEGENRARRAAEEALNSPLLNNTDIQGAQKILLSIMSGAEHELEMDELTEITEYIQEKAGQDAEMIFGHGIDDSLGQNIRVTVIATGFARDAHSINTPGAPSSNVETAPVAAAPVEAPAPAAPAAPVGGNVSAPFVPSFGSSAPEPARVTFDLSGPSAHNAPPLTGIPASAPAEPVLTTNPVPAPSPAPAPEGRSRPAMDAQALERRRRLQELSNGLPPEAVSQYDTPAYLRRQVKLENVEPSSAQNISRFNLSDDNELLGDNRFLHDNVD
jgi:cell division protein FtsZ